MKTGLAALLMVAWLGGSAYAEPVEERRTLSCQEQSEAVRSAVTSVFGKLRGLHRRGLPGPGGKALRDRQVAALVMRHIAPGRFTAEVLRKPWASAEDVFRARWPRVLGTLLQRRFVRALNNPLRYDMAVRDVSLDSPCDEAVVRLSLTERKRRRVAHLTLHLAYQDGVWGVWDVSAKGVSFVKTWRARFGRTATDYAGLESLDKELGVLAERFGVEWAPLPPRVVPPDVVQQQDDVY